MQVITEFHTLDQMHAIYRLDVLMPGEDRWHLAFIGCSEFGSLMKLRDARQNRWVAPKLQRSLQICVTVLETALSTSDAVQRAEALARELQAPGNDPGNYRSGVTRAAVPLIRSDGEQYQSLSHAAEALNCPASSISAHLSGRYGYRTVRGFTFKRMV